MKQKAIYCLLATATIFSSCKKNIFRKAVIQTEMLNNQSYVGSRLTQIVTSIGDTTVLQYGDGEKLKRTLQYTSDHKSRKRTLNCIRTFSYDKEGRLIKTIVENQYDKENLNIYQYSYIANQLSTYTLSTMNIQDPRQPVLTLNFSYSYHYSGGRLSSYSISNGIGETIMESAYNYSSNGKNTIITGSNRQPGLPEERFATELFGDIADPSAIFIPGAVKPSTLLTRDFAYTSDITGKFIQHYKTDTKGRVISVETSYPYQVGVKSKTCYIYESI
ncbi:hypothetical protein GM921_03255 [Pedobacter sp. LMG 31464]|uniref:Uncharacterized protein n=1 Tax=Pedobacter planticolens TaxID=2679964 RepID=A0A923DX93_9SPHI|nr:hypothetical protein [Pedobacter planticolens]MBB2144488.1 hypothetical protein [Pedobacter planticolens]